MASDEGMHVAKISKHVFNACNTFFSTVSYEEVHREVLAILTRQCKNEASVVERAPQRGYYRIRRDTDEGMQLQLQFREAQEEPEQPASTPDLSLSLFDFEDMA